MRHFARLRASLPRRGRHPSIPGTVLAVLFVLMAGFNVLQFYAARRLVRDNAAYRLLLLDVGIECHTLDTSDDGQLHIDCVPARRGEPREDSARVQ